MTELYPNLFIGTVGEIASVPEYKIVNLAHTYHYDLHGWHIRDHVDHSKDPCYVICNTPHLKIPTQEALIPQVSQDILSLNWIDGDAKYFDYKGQGVVNFHRILDFIDTNRKTSKILITCNKSESRAPSVAMVYLAKRTNVLSIPVVNASGLMEGKTVDELVQESKEFEKPSYVSAREQFNRLYRNYYPGYGITQFLIDKWNEL